MAKGKASNFGGKKAAPFAKGGGRVQNSPNDAKGNTRKSGGKASKK